MIFKISLVLLLLFLIIVAGMMFQEHWDVTGVYLFIRSYGLLASVIFILLSCIATILLLPAAFMAFIGGYVFGFTHGLIVNIIGSALGVMCAFLIGRYIATDWVRSRLDNKAGEIVNGVERLGWRFVALFRLTPFVPFDILNFALGITKISVWRYMWASAVFMLPGMVTYTYLGKWGLDIILGHPKFLFIKGVIGIVVLLGIAFITPKITRIVRGKLLYKNP